MNTIKVIALICVILITGCSKEAEITTFNWRLQSHAIATSVDYLELVRMTDNIRLMSNGRLNISAHPAGEIAQGPHIYDAVKERKVEMGNGWPNWWSGQNPAWAVMNAGPFDFMNLDASMMYFFEDKGTELANELSSPDGIVWRPAWWPGMEFGLLSREPITGLDDLKGKKVRIGPGLPSEVLAEASGSYAVPLVPQEIRPALSNGELDAVEWTTANGAWELGLQDICKNAIVPAIWQPSVLSDFLINKSAFEELPEDLQAILETAMRSYTLTTTLKAKVKDIEALAKFRENGTSINKWSKEDIDRWREASDKILTQYKERDAFTAELINSKLGFKNQYDEYYDVFSAYDKQ